MTRLCHVLAFLLAASACALRAQIQLTAVINTEERAVGAIYSMGSAAVDATLETRFRVRNAGATLAQIQTLSLSGVGFSLFQEPATPMALLPNRTVDFFVRFRSTLPTTDARATLRLNSASVTLLAATTSTPEPRLYVLEEDGTRTQRTTEQATVFPPIERGATVSRRFVVENPGAVTLPIAALAVSGDSFRFATAPTVPLLLQARESRVLEVVFRPTTSGVKRATFDIGSSRYPLEGVAREPVFPKPVLTLERTTLESAKQAKVVVKFDAASKAEGAGELRLEFLPAAGAKDDAAIQFLPANRRSVAFQVKEGQSQALFGAAQDIAFQTGTTAGSIKLTASMGGWTAESTVTVDAAAVRVDAVKAVRGTGLLDVTLTGFDNTRSVTEVVFSFYDAEGALIAPGALRANVESPFKTFYESSTAGGLFSLRAAFPVTGSLSLIRAVEAEFRNRVGAQKTQRTSF